MENTAETAIAHGKLPVWLETLLPERSEPEVLSTVLVGTELRVLRLTAPSGSSRDFQTLAQVADAHQGSDLDLAIEDEVYSYFADEYNFLSYPVDEPGYTGMLMGYTDERRQEGLEEAYAAFLENQRLYGEDPDDFVRAWSYIDSHPAFWTAFDLAGHPWHWETQGYCSKLRQSVRRSKAGEIRLSLDGGGHVEHSLGPGQQAYSQHYGDWRLEVTADSFESAIMKLALRVSYAFDSQGESFSEDQFPYPVPEWVLELREIDRKDS